MYADVRISQKFIHTLSENSFPYFYYFFEFEKSVIT